MAEETRLTLGQLRTFLAVAATGSVRAAADQLVVTQPAVSSALAAVRKQVGVALVMRDGRGLRLTPAGQALAEKARAALALLDEAVAAARGEADPDRGRLRLASVTTAGEHLAPPLLASFLAGHPEVAVSLEVGNRRRVADLLAHHEVDLAIGGRPPPGAETLAVRPNHLVVISAPTAPAAEPGRRARAVPRVVTEAELDTATWLLREPGSGTRATSEALLDGLGLSPRILTFGSNGAVVECVRIGLGVTLISADAVADDLKSGALEEWRVPGPPINRPWHLVARTGEPLAPTPNRFLTHLLDSGWVRPGPGGGRA
ncbi:MAG: LysR family transcriptional regulator, low CO2-responsive transcriptional regulator [Actinomycetota bacterium]|nr:LysR family transcriptional regulator, low CO2-responsive transcriptional regulator [Actinomycetota bacterium]